MSHKYQFLKNALKYGRKACDLYLDFKEVKELVDSFLGQKHSKKKYSNFLYEVITETSNLQNLLEIRTEERNQAIEIARVRTAERDHAIESRRKAKLYFWVFGSISCLAFFIIGTCVSLLIASSVY